MDRLGIERKDVEQIIKKGMKWNDKQQKNKWYANMHGYEVVVEEMEDIYYIIAVYAEEADS